MWKYEEAAACFGYFRTTGTPCSIWRDAAQDGKIIKLTWGRDNAVGVATRYGIDVPGLKLWLGRYLFSTLFRMNLVQSLILYSFKIHFSIIHPSIHPDLSL
jgi:hypothetical protein